MAKTNFINSAANDIYSRNQNYENTNSHKTLVPGMNDVVAPGVTPQTGEEANEVPVVGFLYSISKRGVGEYWPLHPGRNTIGSSTDCDICLREATVTEQHAILFVKQMETTGKVLASIMDNGSKTGIYVNNDELGYENHTCKNHDLIKIGKNYVLLLIIIEAQAMGLSVATEFHPLDEAEDEMEMLDIPSNNLYSPSNRNQGGTVSMDGGDNPMAGGTQFL